MKDKVVLVFAITLTLIVEFLLIIVAFNAVGFERLPSQVIRLMVQLILIFWVLSSKSKIGLFLLTAYHLSIGILGLHYNSSIELLEKLLIVFHFGIGLIIYLHDWIETKLGLFKNN